MYLPYLRGKQFELLALKELSSQLSEHGAVQPVIEPVRRKMDALTRCVVELANHGTRVRVVVNPSVGEFASSPSAVDEILEGLAPSAAFETLELAVIVNARTDVGYLRRMIQASPFAGRPLHFVHEEYAGSHDLNSLATADSWHFVEEKGDIRRYRPALNGVTAKLRDRFPARRTNLDYVGAPPTLFTDENLYFQEDGYHGFAALPRSAWLGCDAWAAAVGA